MKKLSLIAIIFLSSSVILSAQPLPDNFQEMIAKQDAMYEKLSNLLESTVDSCNLALKRNQQVFGLTPAFLVADSIKKAIAPGDIELTPPIGLNDVNLLLDRLKMRNSSVNQIVHITSNKTSYLNFSASAFEAKQTQFDEAQKLAQERFEKTEAWGHKNFWRGLGYGAIGGGLVGVLLGLLIN